MKYTKKKTFYFRKIIVQSPNLNYYLDLWKTTLKQQQILIIPYIELTHKSEEVTLRLREALTIDFHIDPLHLHKLNMMRIFKKLPIKLG